MSQEWQFNRGRIMMEGTDILLFQLQKAEVIHNKFDRLLKELAEMDKREDKGFSSIMLSIDGWNDVPEELYEISQVRRFMGKLIRKVPHLLFYLSPGNQMPHQILASLSDVEKFSSGPVSIPEYYKGQHHALIQLPQVMADMMLNAIQTHAAKVDFEDKEGQLPVIYKIIEGLAKN
ncbi:hypothetical protein [Aneurinibacillus tyrosinisolvens]|uniref:hypothetical protein n=1 Tax=Aneurinibacillus tyrosinisolvens TaxID=1443435 RepID=UPI00069B6251|nr:hypothetical protein [Aneurinibacillus tyrosinisolvens]